MNESSANPQVTCLVEFLEERKTAILGEEVHEIPREGVQAVKDASARCQSLAEASEAAGAWDP